MLPSSSLSRDLFHDFNCFLRGRCCHRQKSENLNIFALPTVILFLLLQTRWYRKWKWNYLSQLSRTSRTRLKQLLWKSTVIKLVFLTVTESLVLSNESSRTLLSFHPVQCKMNYTSCCSFDLCECVRHAVSPRHIYFKISDNKKRETGGNHFDIVPTSPVLNLLELWFLPGELIVMMMVGLTWL